MQKAVLVLFWQQAWRYKAYVIGILVLLPVTLLMHAFLPPVVLAEVLNRLSTGDYVKGDLWGSFGWLLVAFIFLRFTSATFLWRAVIVLLVQLEARVVHAFDRRIFQHLMLQSIEFHNNHFGGSLVAAATRFTNAYARLAESIVMQFIPLLLSFTFATIILLPRAPLYVMCLLVFSAIYIVITIFGTRKVRQKTAAEAAAYSMQTGVLADSITNVLAVKSFGAENYETKRFKQAADKRRSTFLSMMRTVQSRELSFSMITATITSVSIVLAVASVVVFDADIATTFLIIEYTGLLTARLWEFTIGTLRTYNRAIGDASDITTILAQPPQVQDVLKPLQPHIAKGAIRFQKVDFTHVGAHDAVFTQFTLSVKPGEKLGVVGHSGAGKSTLVKLLLRFADIDNGAIYLDGQDITTLRQADLRTHIAYVPQEPLLFHRTLAENIRYGRPNATDEQVAAAAQLAYADEFITHMPEGYQTLVGERGIKLSGGQKQRIAIARAILKNAPILVLDEATSALDSESEKAIQAALANLMQQKTAIVIAHRLSTIQKLDRIIVLEKGAIVEEGTHEQLLANKGTYALLWQHQSGGFIS